MISTTIQVAGVKDTINQLGKIDKQLQKDFKADAIAIAAPAIKALLNKATLLQQFLRQPAVKTQTN